MFEDSLPPTHVERAINECRTIFSHLRTDHKNRIAEVFATPYDNIDITVAWDAFDPLTYQTLFKETGGDLDMLYDPGVRSRVLSRVFNAWPIFYHLRMLDKEGIMDTLEVKGSTLYFFKDVYKESINTLSKQASAKPGK